MIEEGSLKDKLLSLENDKNKTTEKIREQKEMILKKRQSLELLLNVLNNRNNDEIQIYTSKIKNAKSNLEKLKMQIEYHLSFEMKIETLKKKKINESKNVGKKVFVFSFAVVIVSYFTLYNIVRS